MDENLNLNGEEKELLEEQQDANIQQEQPLAQPEMYIQAEELPQGNIPQYGSQQAVNPDDPYGYNNQYYQQNNGYGQYQYPPEQQEYGYNPPLQNGYGQYYTNPQPAQPVYNQPQGYTAYYNNYYNTPPVYAKPQEPKPKKEKPPTKHKAAKLVAIFVSIAIILSGGGALAVSLITPSPEENIGDKTNTSLEIKDTPQTDVGGGVIGEAMTPQQIYSTVESSIVGISVYSRSITLTLAGQGSGVIFSKDGYIVTNAHVILNSDKEIHPRIAVTLSTGEEYTARVVGYDKESDLAVLKIDANNLKAAVFGDSTKVVVGDEAYVIGNPSGLQFAGSMTEGIISALERNVYVNSLGSTMQYLQTSAAINPGNSGGALINVYGQVIGITSAKVSAEGFEGMGFAIPINNAKPIIDEILETGTVGERGYLGISYIAISDANAQVAGVKKGLRVVDILEGSDATNRGVKIGDIIYKIDDVECYNTTTLSQALRGKKVGTTVTLSISRTTEDGKTEDIETPITLIKNPSEE